MLNSLPTAQNHKKLLLMRCYSGIKVDMKWKNVFLTLSDHIHGHIEPIFNNISKTNFNSMYFYIKIQKQNLKFSYINLYQPFSTNNITTSTHQPPCGQTGLHQASGLLSDAVFARSTKGNKNETLGFWSHAEDGTNPRWGDVYTTVIFPSSVKASLGSLEKESCCSAAADVLFLSVKHSDTNRWRL